MSSIGAAQRAGVPVSSARAGASRSNGAKSRGTKTSEGKAKSSQNALKHGLRAEKYAVLPEEDAGEFEALEAALLEELAPVGALQGVLARRIARAAWRLARADRIETELFEERHFAAGGLGLALIRDGNGTRSFETLLRYRGAAMAELMRSLRALKALQAEQATENEPALESRPRPAARPSLVHGPQPNEPGRGSPLPLDDFTPEASPLGHALHESAARWMPNEPEPAPGLPPAGAPRGPALHGRPSEPGRPSWSDPK
jgi:hypothetical protein